MKKILTEEEIFAEFAKKFPKKAKQKKSAFSTKELKTYNSVWKEEFTSRRGRYKTEFFDTNKEIEYKNCLFAIYKHHWDTDNGFQINMENVGKMINKSYKTVDRMILFFIKCGLLKRCHNYLVGNQTYFYHKNTALFNHLFKGNTQDYKNWLYQSRLSNVDNNQYKLNNQNKDVNNNSMYCSNIDTNRNGETGKKKNLSDLYGGGAVSSSSDIVIDSNLNKLDSKNNINNVSNICSNVDTNRNLYLKIANEFLPILDKLNKKQHPDLQIDFGLHFDGKGNFSGRSSSYFCLTLNENKDHNTDNSMETRSEFLKRMELSDYKEVYDIKSEVPRTTILANTGIWKPDIYDIYTKIIKESGVIVNNNQEFYTQGELLKMDQIYTRDVIKDLYMRFNFGKGTDKQRFNYYRNSRIKTLQKEYGLKSFNAAERLYYYRLQDDSKYEIPDAKRQYMELEYTFDEWVELRKAIEKIQGKSWGNLIFWFTSMIQVYTVYKVFQEKKIRIYNVYDGFYAPPSITKKYMVNIVKQTANYIYEKYIKGIKI